MEQKVYKTVGKSFRKKVLLRIILVFSCCEDYKSKLAIIYY